VKKIPVYLPPLSEQRRIVAKIEELFTRLDAGIEALKRVKKELKRYRQTVLKSAFEGKLTAEWREAHKDELEKASVLLIKILRKKEKESKKKRNSFSPLEDFDLEILPDTWLWLTLDYLSTGNKNSIKRGPFGSTIKKEFFVNNGYKVYQQKNVIYNDFDWGDYFIDEEKFEELKSFEVKSKDILMSCSGTIGKIAIVPEGIRPGIINQALLKIALDNSVVATRYFVYLFRSKIGKIISGNTRGSAMVNISSVRDLKQISFPLPLLPEQHKIVQEIESRLSVADEVERTVEQSLKQSNRLRQSILKKAFEGKLVPQDSSDEPAEKLLERIKAEKAKRETEKKRKRRGKTRINLKQRELL